MWIKSIRVNNFGRIQGLDMSFQKGVNSYIKHNGWGKSTIAAFIKVMFYGFDGDKTRDTIRNERRRFKPWQGGVYGGSMDIEWEGKSYTIFRTFGSKPIDDEIKVLDNTTGLPTDELGAIPGETIFGIDAEGYRRTAYIGQSDCPTSTNDSVNARLGDLSNKEFDINKYEAAMEKINSLKSSINPSGRTYSAKKDKELLDEMMVKLRSMANLDEDVNSIEAELEALKQTDISLGKELGRLDERREVVSSDERVKGLREKYDWFLGKREEIQTDIDIKGDQLSQTNPSIERVDEVVDLFRRMKLEEDRVKQYALDDASEKRFEELDRVFAGKNYDSSVTNSHIEAIKKDRSSLEEQEREGLSSTEEERLKDLSDLFNRETETTETVEKLIDRCDELNRRRTKLSVDKDNLKDKKETFKPKRAGVPTVIIIGILLLIMSGGFYLSNLKLAIAIAGLGAVTIIVGIITFIKNIGKCKEANRIAEDELFHLEEDIREEAEAISDREEQLRNQLWKYRVHYDSATTGSDLSRLLRDSGEYEQLQIKQKRYQQEKNKLNSRIKDAEYIRYLESYGIETDWDNYIDALYSLESDYKDYKAINEKFRELKIHEDNYNNTRSLALQGFTELGIALEEGEEGLNNIRRLTIEYLGAMEQLKRIEEELKGFEGEHEEDMEAVRAFNPEAAAEDYESINEEFNRITEERESCRELRHKKEKTLEDLKRQEEDRDVMLESCETLKESMKKKAEDFSLLSKAAEHLVIAKNGMMAKYVTPVQKVFEDILKKSMGETDEKYKIDAKANITVEELGLPRETSQMSTGYQDFIGLLFRLSMIEVMYKGDKPVLVMDDPFACMDESHLKGARELMRYISENYQVVYFTCTEARQI